MAKQKVFLQVFIHSYLWVFLRFICFYYNKIRTDEKFLILCFAQNKHNVLLLAVSVVIMFFAAEIQELSKDIHAK